LSVVSSDREIRAVAREAGAADVGCDDFVRELKATLRRGREAREMEKTEERSSALDVQLWAEAFARKKHA